MNSSQRKAFFEKLKNNPGQGQPKQASNFHPYPGDAMTLGKNPSPQAVTLHAMANRAPTQIKPISNQPPQIKEIPDQFLKPMQSENRQMSKKTKLPKLQSFFKAPGV